MGSNQKIGILINCLEMGGAQKMALQVFDILEKKYCHVYLMTIDHNRGMNLHPEPVRARQLEEKTVSLSRMDNDRPTCYKIAAAPFQYMKLLSVIKHLDLEILLSFEDRANIFNMVSVLTKKRIISVRHPMKSVLDVKEPLKKQLISLFFSVAAHRISTANFNSHASMAEFVTLFPLPGQKVSVIYNFCDHARLDRLKNRLPKTDKDQSILPGRFVAACGRFKPVKGFANLIRAFGKVAHHNADVVLVILGDGPLKPDLMALVQDLGLADRVVFTGFCTNTAPWLARAAVFVLTSQSEGFPNVLLEAMALKTAVVSVDCTAGPREILSPDTDFTRKTKKIDWAPFGVLTPPMIHTCPVPGSPLDPSEQYLADAVVALLEDPQLQARYESAGYQRSLDFSVSARQNEWLDLISSDRVSRSAPK